MECVESNDSLGTCNTLPINQELKDLQLQVRSEAESKEQLTPVVSIVVQEFSNFCKKGCVFDSYEELMINFQQVIDSIGIAIQEENPSLFENEISLEKLSEILIHEGYHLDISANSMFVEEEEKSVFFVGVHKILNREGATFEHYLPDVASSNSSSYPKIEVLTVGEDLINFEEMIKAQAGLISFSKHGSTSNQRIILYQEGIEDAVQNTDFLTEEKYKKAVLANEMGHIIFDYIFLNVDTSLYYDMTFELTTGDEFQFGAVGEAVSDIIELNSATDNDQVFAFLLNQKIGAQRMLKKYEFSIHILQETLEEVMKEMGIYDNAISEDDFDFFRRSFLQKANDKIWSIVTLLVEHFENNKETLNE